MLHSERLAVTAQPPLWNFVVPFEVKDFKEQSFNLKMRADNKGCKEHVWITIIPLGLDGNLRLLESVMKLHCNDCTLGRGQSL